MGRINMNQLARAVTLKEGKKQQVNIAQVKEVLKVALRLMSEHRPSTIMATIEHYSKPW